MVPLQVHDKIFASVDADNRFVFDDDVTNPKTLRKARVKFTVLKYNISRDKRSAASGVTSEVTRF